MFLPLVLVPPRGKCCPFFSFRVFCVWSGVFCCFLPFVCSKGRFLEKFSGANFCFWVVVLVLCFLVGFCYCFCFIFWRSAPEPVWKNSIDVRSGFFWVRSLSLRFFFRRRVLFFFKRQRSGSNRTPPTHLFGFSFSLFVSRRAFCFALFGRASCFSAFFSGCLSGPRAFFGFSLDLLRPFSWDARRQGFSCASLALCSFPPFLFVLRPHTF